jgi:hypothetical protein
MKILNRPMFRMGGPIKEGIMNNIKEPRQRYAEAGDVFKRIAEGYQTGPQVSEPLRINQQPRSDVLNAASQLGIANPYKDNSKIYMPMAMNKTVTKPTDLSPDVATMGGYGEIEKPYIDFQKIPKYIEDQDGDGIRDINPEYTKNKSFVNDIFGGPFKRKTDERFAPKSITRPESDFLPNAGPIKPGMKTTVEEIIEKKGITDDTPLTKKERTNNILEMLGYDKAKKNALYDAMIKAGQRVSRTGLGADNLVSDIIQDTSTSYDKPEKLREAANLMDVQQQLKLDQIDASKDKRAPIQKTIEYYMSEDGGNLSRKDATASAKNQPIEAFAIFQEAKSKGTTTEAVDYTASKMASDDKFGEGLRFINRIPTKLKGAEGLQKFIESDAYNGDGVYTRGGEILVIKNGKATNMITFKGTGETGIFGGEK